jgi:hypothetical protein
MLNTSEVALWIRTGPVVPYEVRDNVIFERMTKGGYIDGGPVAYVAKDTKEFADMTRGHMRVLEFSRRPYSHEEVTKMLAQAAKELN